MSARARILDTFESIVLAEGERAATLDAVAARAGVSKGGLLYHFPGREALIDGLVQRAEELGAEYLDILSSAEEGPALAYIRTSAEIGTPFDRTFITLSKLGGEQHPTATAALQRAQRTWTELIEAEVGDPVTARVIALLGDGMYYNALFKGEEADLDIDALLNVVKTLKTMIPRKD